MSKSSLHTWKALLAKALVAVLVILSVAILPTASAKAATAPKLTKSSINILIGNTYNLDVAFKVEHSSYTWSSDNKSVATVNNIGYVTGIKKGSAVISCTVKSLFNKYQLTCKVTVVRPAIVFRIKNEISTLNVGQVYMVEELLAPASSNDVVTWSSSNTAVVKIDKEGKLAALKEGMVKITGKTLAGKTDAMFVNIISKDGYVKTQTELEKLLGSGVGLITIKTNEAIDFNIPSGDYTNTKLVVDAPKADIHNFGRFSSIDINQIASNSWYEEAVGNLLNILSTDSRIVVGPDAKVKIEVSTEGAKLRIENNGSVEELVIMKAADVDISGKAGNDFPVVVSVPNITISTSVPLNLNCTNKFTLVLLAGSENTKIQADSSNVIPTIQSSNKSLVRVTVGTGANVKVVDMVPVPIDSAGSSSGTGGTGGSDGTGSSGGTGGTGGGSTNTYVKTFILDRPISEITAINISYLGKAYTISKASLDILIQMLDSNSAYLPVWKDMYDSSMSYDGQTFTITGTAGGTTKTVTFTGGQFDGKAFTVTANADSSVAIVSNTTNVAFNVSKGADDKTLIITGEPSRLAGLTFTVITDTIYTLEQPYTQLSAIDISYAGSTYEINSGILSLLNLFLSNESGYLAVWTNTKDTTNTYNGQTVNVKGVAGSTTKTVTFINGPLDGKSYTVTVNTDRSVTVVSFVTGVSFTVQKGTDSKSLTITGSPQGLVFAPTFN